MSELQDLLKQADSHRHTHMTVTEEVIVTLHQILFPGMSPESADRYRTVPVSGSGHFAPDPEDIPRLMGHLADQIHSSSFNLHPIELAAMAYKRLVDIHPFPEGNKRTACLLMNLILVNAGYRAVAIPPDRHPDCQNALNESREQKDIEPFSRFIAELVIHK